jgi:hypothetical protein
MGHINTIPEDGIYSVSLLNKDQESQLSMITMAIEDSRYGLSPDTILEIDMVEDRYVLLALIIQCAQEQSDPRYRRAGRHASNRLYHLFQP